MRIAGYRETCSLLFHCFSPGGRKYTGDSLEQDTAVTPETGLRRILVIEAGFAWQEIANVEIRQLGFRNVREELFFIAEDQGGGAGYPRFCGKRLAVNFSGLAPELLQIGTWAHNRHFSSQHIEQLR